MNHTVSATRLTPQRELPEVSQNRAKASLKTVKAQPEKAEVPDYKARIAEEIICPLFAGLSLKEVSDLIERASGRAIDFREIARWKDANARPQFDAIIAVPQFRPRLLLLWAAFIQRLTSKVRTKTVISVEEEDVA